MSNVEVGASLELCSCPWKLCEPWLQKLFNKNNYPLVQIHCIIKIMCQDLPLGCLNCLFGVCCAKTETFAVVFEFLYFTGTWKNSEIFIQYCYAIFLVFSYFFRIFGVTEVYVSSASLQTVLFSQIAVIVSLFAYVWNLVEPHWLGSHRIVIAYSG
jgi:hypothetical protein